MISIRRTVDRAETVQPGVVTRHCFSAGGHYDPANTGFGALIGVDEHLVAPGAGFAWHPHRGVEIVSWVLDGALRHEDSSGRVCTVPAGTAQFQVAGSGIEHSETNASASIPLRFVQMTLLGDVSEPRYLLTEPPVRATGGDFSVHRAGRRRFDGPLVHLYVARGSFDVAGEQLGDGGSVRSENPVTADGVGE
ncbi:MAG: Pirin domain protein, partial [Pseudonocardiales bacterium]|nr:Pirin domain protein [Pseudonocardiales bacterium]